MARPAGAWIVEDSGSVRWHPAVDVTRIALLGQLATTAALILLGMLKRLRSVPGGRHVTSLQG